MVWIALKDGNSGQVVKGIRLSNPKDHNVYEVVKSKRLGINRYLITLVDMTTGSELAVTNHEIKKNNWTLVGRWHTPEEISIIFGRSKVDPDANLPRPKRLSFWTMRSKPGTHNYKQKIKLMEDEWYKEKFGHLFDTTIVRD